MQVAEEDRAIIILESLEFILDLKTSSNQSKLIIQQIQE